MPSNHNNQYIDARPLAGYVVGPNDSGKYCIEIHFDCLMGQVRKRRERFYISSPKARDITMGVLKECGWDGNKNKARLNLTAPLVTLVIGEDEYMGKTRERIKFVNGPSRAATDKDASRELLKMVEEVRNDSGPPPRDVVEDQLPF